jgi:hypothetical protein
MTRASILLTVLVAACAVSSTRSAQQSSPNFAASPNPHIRLFANVLRQAIWPNRRIFACWEELSEAQSSDRNLVRAAVTRTWERESAARFVGWQRCAAENAGIRIAVEDTGPHTIALGRNLDRRRNGMVLNFEFKKWSQACQANRTLCIESIAVHEFGHALGFAHEQNRFDAPGECQQLRQGPNGDLLMTPYDPRSVMNYCNPTYNNNGVLSQLDSQAVREVYGAPDGG